MQNGERAKILMDNSLAWAVTYGTYGYSMALSPDKTFLIAGSSFSSNAHLGKINSANGAVLASYSAA